MNTVADAVRLAEATVWTRSNKPLGVCSTTDLIPVPIRNSIPGRIIYIRDGLATLASAAIPIDSKYIGVHWPVSIWTSNFETLEASDIAETETFCQAKAVDQLELNSNIKSSFSTSRRPTLRNSLRVASFSNLIKVLQIELSECF